MIIYKNIKRIALGAVVAATLCFLGSYKANADRLELSVYVRGGALAGEYTVFGDKAPGEDSKDAKEEDKKFKLMDTVAFRLGGSFGYTYDIVEYFGVGIVAGAGWTETKQLSVKKDVTGKITFGLLQGFGGLRFDVYPLGEQSFIFGLDLLAKLNISSASMIKSTASNISDTEIKTETVKAIPVFAGAGARLRVGYDFRELIDFPVFLGLDADFTWYPKGIIASNKPSAEITVFGEKIEKDTEGHKSPSLDFSVGASVAIDFAYYIF